MTRLDIACVVGARPNFMKMAPLMDQFARRRDRFDAKLVHTGQHYDAQMSDVFFEELGLPKPDIHLGVGSGSHAAIYARHVWEEMEARVLGPDAAGVTLADKFSSLDFL